MFILTNVKTITFWNILILRGLVGPTRRVLTEISATTDTHTHTVCFLLVLGLQLIPIFVEVIRGEVVLNLAD